MTCPNCGAAVAENRRFCGKCGTDLSPEASSASAPPPPFASAPAPSAPSAWGNAPAPPPAAPPGGTAGSPATSADPFAPPDLNPGYPPPQWPQPQAGYPPPPAGGPGGYPPPQYSQPGAGYPAAGSGWAGYGYPAVQTSGLAIASLVLGLIGWAFCGIGSVLAIVFGFIARGQIRAILRPPDRLRNGDRGHHPRLHRNRSPPRVLHRQPRREHRELSGSGSRASRSILVRRRGAG